MVKEQMILGKDAVYSMNPNETGINNNVLTVGSSGSGKTLSIVVPRLLQTAQSSLVVTLTKRKLVKQYARLFMKRGYRVFDLNLTNPPESTVAYDPMQPVKTDADVIALAKAIVLANTKKENSTADPFWDDEAISLLTAEIAMVRILDPEATFADVLDFHDKLDLQLQNDTSTNYDTLFARLEKSDPSCLAVRCWKSFCNLPPKTSACVYGTLNTAMDTIFTKDLRTLMHGSNILHFSEIADTKTILFITTSPVNDAHHAFVSFLYAQLFRELFEYAESLPDGALKIPVTVICDDFATGGQIAMFDQLISVFREKNISVVLLIQSESQLVSMYGEQKAITIMNNCDTYVYLGGNDLSTAKGISIRLNKPLEDVLYLPVGKVIIFRRGSRPLLTERYPITEDKQYQELTRTSKKGGKTI